MITGRSHTQSRGQRIDSLHHRNRAAGKPDVSFPQFDHIGENVLKSMIPKCSLDPMPTWLVKRHLTVLLPVLLRIVNLSLSYVVVLCAYFRLSKCLEDVQAWLVMSKLNLISRQNLSLLHHKAI